MGARSVYNEITFSCSGGRLSCGKFAFLLVKLCEIFSRSVAETYNRVPPLFKDPPFWIVVRGREDGYNDTVVVTFRGIKSEGGRIFRIISDIFHKSRDILSS